MEADMIPPQASQRTGRRVVPGELERLAPISGFRAWLGLSS
jgi:hypothetical protein